MTPTPAAEEAELRSLEGGASPPRRKASRRGSASSPLELDAYSVDAQGHRIDDYGPEIITLSTGTRLGPDSEVAADVEDSQAAQPSARRASGARTPSTWRGAPAQRTKLRCATRWMNRPLTYHF